MKEKVQNLLNPQIEKFNAVIDDVYIEKVDNKPVLNIVVDSDDLIDLDLITEISRVVNENIDNSDIITEDFDELDVYAKSKGGKDYE